MSDNNHDNFETEPKNAYENLQLHGFISPEGDIEKQRFVEASRSWTEEREAPFEAWEDVELLEMIIRMDPRDPEEFELQQHLASIWRKRVRSRHEDL